MTPTVPPLSIGRVALTVRDLSAVGDFYARVLGLSRLSGDGETATLGAGARPLLELRRDPAARSAPHEAGLFHTAVLLPGRTDLGRWLRHAGELGLRLDGAADHEVSEAVYLRDPEGNGIEVYADRPRDRWHVNGTHVRMVNAPLDIPGLLAAPGAWQGAPDGTVVGHVHLQVGQLPEAEAFYTGPLGLDLTERFDGAASFYAAGGYHHHLASNIWNSRGAGQRTPGTAGLAEVELLVGPNGPAPVGDYTDPWGTHIAVRPA